MHPVGHKKAESRGGLTPWPPARTCILQAASCILFLLLLAPALAGKEELAALPSPGTTPAQVRLLADDHYFPVLLDAINGARHRIDMVMFLLKTSDRKNNRPARLVAALIKARQRGVRVEVVLEHSGYNDSINGDNQQAAATLRANDIKVRFDSPRRTAHTKLVVIDSRFSFVGSHNLSQAALTYNHEMSLLLDNRQLAGELTDYIAAIPEHHESF